MSSRPAWGLLVWGLSPVWHTTPVRKLTKMSRTKNQSIIASRSHTGCGQRALLSKHSRNGTMTMLYSRKTVDSPSQATLQRQCGCSTSRARPSGRAGARVTSSRAHLEAALASSSLDAVEDLRPLSGDSSPSSSRMVVDMLARVVSREIGDRAPTDQPGEKELLYL